MSYKILSIPRFDKDFKRLSKKYHSLKNDLVSLTVELSENPKLGTMITPGC